MMRMVNDILALIELQAGKLYPRREPFSLRGLFDSLRAQYAPRAEEKGLRFALQLDDSLPDTLEGDGMLLKLGYRVRTADNGSEALELLARERPDGVLLDCQMPVMDGFATCRAIRALPGCAELPVLALTAHSHSGDRERCLAAGMSDYMAKPVKFEELQTLLHDWLLCQPIVTKSA